VVVARTSDRGFDVTTFLRWAETVGAALGAARAEIDALNVFPVPDSDTGTNLYLTWESALEAAAQAADADLPEVAQAFVDGALTGARGNSGIILAQLLRTGIPVLLDGVSPTGALVADSVVDALVRAAGAARHAVARPQEGTVLSVADAAASAARDALPQVSGLDRRRAVHVVLRAATTAARAALTRTPEQMPLLARRGVVDAGGRGLVVLLDATERAVTGRWSEAGSVRHPLPVPVAAAAGDVEGPGSGYELMFLLNAPDEVVPALQARLDALGDSVVVVGGDGLWNVHAHVDDVGLALEAALEAGRPHRIRVTHFADPAAHASRAGAPPAAAQDARRSVVAMAAGPGLEKLFAEAGARVVRGSADLRPSTAELLAAAHSSEASEVVLLPNDHVAINAAEVAAIQARREGLRVAVVPTRTQVQGLAAVAVHDPARDFDDDVVAMSAAAGHTRHGGVTLATGRAMTMAGPCEPGDVLGVVDGDFVVVGHDLGTVAVQVLERLLSGGGELVTVVAGAGAPAGLGESVTAGLRLGHPEVDTVVYDGGQERYPLWLGVE
jgi:DAK2 domain fusion protein YloV